VGNPSQLVRCSLEYDHKNTLITLTHIYTTTKNGHATGLTVFWELKMNTENKKLFINNEKDEQINIYIFSMWYTCLYIKKKVEK